jgi:hypothetical protein
MSRSTLTLILSETCLISLALVGISGLQTAPREFVALFTSRLFLLQALAVAAIFQFSFYFHDLFDLTAFRPPAEQFLLVVRSLATASLLLGGLYLLLQRLGAASTIPFLAIILSGVVAGVLRLALSRVWIPAGNVAQLETDSGAPVLQRLGDTAVLLTFATLFRAAVLTLRLLRRH